MSVVTCPNCFTPAPPGAVFCDICGYDLRSVAPGAPQPTPPTYMVPEGGEVICPSCHHSNLPGSLFCDACGTRLPQVSQSAPPAPPPPQYPPTPPQPQAPPQPPVAPPPPPVVEMVRGRLVIQESQVSLPIPPGKQTIIIGREDPVSGIFPDIDLDPHGGHEAGVGRRHAQLTARGGQVYIEDLESVNGTVVNRQRLAPHQPRALSSGDEIRLGKMVLLYYEQ